MPHLDVHSRPVCRRAKAALWQPQRISVSTLITPPAGSDPTNSIREGDDMPTTQYGHSLVEAAEGELIEAAGNRILIKVATPSQLVCDYSAAPGFPGPPLHIHPGFDETYLVLEGRLEIVVDEQCSELSSGAVAYVSGSVPHTFRNPRDERARFLSICSPGGFEHFFRAVAAGDGRAIAEISQRFGYRAVETIRA
jgi:mannose-6-phosphate isomerase-like protein (cupin superfamily)